MVDDDQVVLDAVAVSLRNEGFIVCAETDAESAVRRAEEFRPDLAILDVRLPKGTEGFDLGRRLRASSDVLIVYVTAADGLGDRLTGFGVGADDYLVKPFAIAELIARVKAVLRRTGAQIQSVWTVSREDEQAFDRFVSSGPLGGSGLGLPIARGLIRAHGGDVTFDGAGLCDQRSVPSSDGSIPSNQRWSHPAPKAALSGLKSRRARGVAVGC